MIWTEGRLSNLNKWYESKIILSPHSIKKKLYLKIDYSYKVHNLNQNVSEEVR